MSDEPLLPHRMTLLGEAMHPIWSDLETQIDMPVSQISGEIVDIAKLASHHLDALQGAMQRMEGRIDGLMTNVISNQSADDADVYRAVGRLESTIDDMLEHYRIIRALGVAGTDADARDLLADVYRHTLVEIRDWMEELVEVIADPMAAVVKRGLPTSGHVELPLSLTLTAAPALDLLSRWVERRSASLAQSATSSGLGFWGTVGAIALGWGIGDALFRDHDCRHD